MFFFPGESGFVNYAKYGYIEIVQQSGGRFIKLKEHKNYLSMIEISDRQVLKEVKDTFGHYSQNELIRYTYQKYPYYAINSCIANQLLTPDELKIVEKQKNKYRIPVV